MLSDATSGTILYEDVVYDWQGQHQALYDRVELFKEKNGMDESVKYTDDEFRKVFRPLFTSMDKAYHSFNPLAIEMALDSPDMLEAILNGNFPMESRRRSSSRSTTAADTVWNSVSLWSAPNKHNLHADFSATYSFHH